MDCIWHSPQTDSFVEVLAERVDMDYRGMLNSIRTRIGIGAMRAASMGVREGYFAAVRFMYFFFLTQSIHKKILPNNYLKLRVMRPP